LLAVSVGRLVKKQGVATHGMCFRGQQLMHNLHMVPRSSSVAIRDDEAYQRRKKELFPVRIKK
jgi:hypothetical protein